MQITLQLSPPDAPLTLAVFINAAGPNVFLENIMQTVYSISGNIGMEDFGFYIVFDKQSVANSFFAMVCDNSLLMSHILDISVSHDSWASTFNVFFQKFRRITRYIMIAHDDIIINTPLFWESCQRIITTSRNPIGWITFTNDAYYRFNGIPLSNSIRPGFAPDRQNRRTFEWHNVKEEKLTPKISQLMDLPSGPVKCHGVLSHIMLISVEALSRIGECEDWSKYTMLIDEDWSLCALKNGFTNIWIPSVVYTHPNPYNARKRIRDLRFERMVHEQFKKKWACEPPYTEEDIRLIKENYSGTNLVWSIERKTYEWDYL